MVVMAVVAILLGLLMPTLASVRQTAYRVISAGNQRTLGQGLTIWAGARYGTLPPSRVLEEEDDPPMGELLRVYAPRTTGAGAGHDEASIVRQSGPSRRGAWIDATTHDWDGLGHLFASGVVAESEVFYSPAHWGEHTHRRYAEDWVRPDGLAPELQPDHVVYGNYHYLGHLNSRGRPILLEDAGNRIIATDGMRRRSDLNHRSGLNLLKADGSVRWQHDPSLLPRLPIDVPLMHTLVRHNETIRSIFSNPWDSDAYWLDGDNGNDD